MVAQLNTMLYRQGITVCLYAARCRHPASQGQKRHILCIHLTHLCPSCMSTHEQLYPFPRMNDRSIPNIGAHDNWARSSLSEAILCARALLVKSPPLCFSCQALSNARSPPPLADASIGTPARGLEPSSRKGGGEGIRQYEQLIQA